MKSKQLAGIGNPSVVQHGIAIAVLVVLVGLGSPSSAQVSVTISPSVITVATLATQSFTATVTGSTNTAVTWQVNGVGGGSSANGQVSTTVLGTANEALYLAPSAVPSPASVSVTAVSQADPVALAIGEDVLRLDQRQ